jgi:hypothetical protein
MRTLRLLTILMTLLTLPGYGLAGIQARSCQSQMSGANLTAIAGDCCPGKSGQGDSCKGSGNTGLPGKNTPCSQCKAGYNCKSPESYEPNHLIATPAVAPRVAIAVRTVSLPLSNSPAGLWRPPRLG